MLLREFAVTGSLIKEAVNATLLSYPNFLFSYFTWMFHSMDYKLSTIILCIYMLYEHMYVHIDINMC